MAILKVVNVKIGRNASLKGIINYVLQPKKTEEKLTTGFCCDVPNALETFMETKRCFNKLKDRQYYHFVQSFPPNENITAQKAHEAAVKFAEKCRKFWGFEMLIVTHKSEHLHTHFVMNSVSFVDGHKFHITRKELASIKELQNQICIDLGYSAAPKKGFDMFGKVRTAITANNSKTFRILKKAEVKQKDSYLQNCKEAFIKSLKIARTKDQFIQLMHAQGFETDWKDCKKHITFTYIKLKNAGAKKCKVRLNKLAQYFPALKEFQTKENLLYGIRRNITLRNESDNNRFVVTTNATNKPKFGTYSAIIDFNTGYENYSARIDSERNVRTVEKNTRFDRERGRTDKSEQGTTRKDRTNLQPQNTELSEFNRDTIKNLKNGNKGGIDLCL